MCYFTKGKAVKKLLLILLFFAPLGLWAQTLTQIPYDTVWTYPIYPAECKLATVSSDGKYVYAFSNTFNIILNAHNGSFIKNLTNWTDTVDHVSSFSLSADNSTIAAVTGNGSLVVWDSTGNLIKVLNKSQIGDTTLVRDPYSDKFYYPDAGPLSIAIDSTGKHIYFSVCTSKYWSQMKFGILDLAADTIRYIPDMPLGLNRITLFPDGKKFAAILTDENYMDNLFIYDANTFKQISQLGKAVFSGGFHDITASNNYLMAVDRYPNVWSISDNTKRTFSDTTFDNFYANIILNEASNYFYLVQSPIDNEFSYIVKYSLSDFTPLFRLNIGNDVTMHLLKNYNDCFFFVTFNNLVCIRPNWQSPVEDQENSKVINIDINNGIVNIGINQANSDLIFNSAELIDTAGNTILNTTLSQIDCNALPHNVYFIKINTNKGSFVKKIML